jgi:hypothetical protein
VGVPESDLSSRELAGNLRGANVADASINDNNNLVFDGARRCRRLAARGLVPGRLAAGDWRLAARGWLPGRRLAAARRAAGAGAAAGARAAAPSCSTGR